MIVIKKRLLTFSEKHDAFMLLKVFEDLFRTQNLEELNLTGGASATVTTALVGTATVNGVLVNIPTASNMAALNGPNIPNTGNTWQCWLMTVNSSGSFFTYPGVPGATLAQVGIPVPAESNGTQAVLGFLTINNQSAGAFVPGTTLLNVSGLNPVINNITGPFYPVPPL